MGFGTNVAASRVLKFHLRLVACFFASCALVAFALNAFLLVSTLSSRADAGHLAANHSQVKKLDWVSQDQAQDDVLNLPSFCDGLVIHRLIPVAFSALAAADVPLHSLDVSSLLVLSRPPPASV